MKKAIVSLGKVINGLDDRFDNACLSLERKVCNGSTIDEKLDVMDAKVVNVSKVVSHKAVKALKPVTKISFYKSTPKVKEDVSPAVPTPFTPCTDTFNRKPASVKSSVRVQAIPLTQVCSCGERIPVDAAFCPMCSVQLIVPMAKCGPAPITACKIKGITPHKIYTPVKPTLASRIKDALNTDIRKLGMPFGKMRIR